MCHTRSQAKMAKILPLNYHMYTYANGQLLTPCETTLQEFLSHSSSEQQWRLELANQELLQLYFVLNLGLLQRDCPCNQFTAVCSGTTC